MWFQFHLGVHTVHSGIPKSSFKTNGMIDTMWLNFGKVHKARIMLSSCFEDMNIVWFCMFTDSWNCGRITITYTPIIYLKINHHSQPSTKPCNQPKCQPFHTIHWRHNFTPPTEVGWLMDATITSGFLVTYLNQIIFNHVSLAALEWVKLILNQGTVPRPPWYSSMWIRSRKRG